MTEAAAPAAAAAESAPAAAASSAPTSAPAEGFAVEGKINVGFTVPEGDIMSFAPDDERVIISETPGQAEAPPDTGSLIQPTPETPWFEALPQSAHKNPSITKYKSMEDFVQGYENLTRLAGQKALTRPEPNADPEVWNNYYKTLGRPTSPDGYKWEPSNQDFVEIDQTSYNETKKVLHEAGLTNEQFNAVMSLYESDVAENARNELQKLSNEKANAMKALHDAWGPKLNKNLQQAQNAIQKFGLADTITEFGLQNNATMITMMYEIAQLTGEHNVDTTDMFGNSTPQSFDTAVQQLRASEAYRNTNHPDNHKVNQQLKEMYERRYK